jgi:hypothetical protein
LRQVANREKKVKKKLIVVLGSADFPVLEGNNTKDHEVNYGTAYSK